MTVCWTAERKCHRLNKQMAAFVLLVQSVFVIALFHSVYCICVGNFDTSTYFLPMKFAPPFNIDSLFGWYPFLAFQFVSSLTYFCGTVVATGYFVCCCFYVGALCDHFDYLIETFDAELRENPNSLNARKILINAIDHHNKIHE